MEVKGQLYVLATLPPQKRNPVPIAYEAGWALQPVWIIWRRWKLFASARIQTPNRPYLSLVAIPTMLYWLPHTKEYNNTNVKVKESRNKARCGPEGFRRFRIPDFMTFGTWRWWGCQPQAPAAFTPRECSWYPFSLGSESTPGPWYSQKEYVTEKSSDTTVNRSWDCPTSSAIS
jgi:hypothetical protein